MWYLSSWRDLRRRSNAGHGLLNKPEITPPSHSNHRRDGTRGIEVPALVQSGYFAAHAACAGMDLARKAPGEPLPKRGLRVQSGQQSPSGTPAHVMVWLL